MLVTNRREYKSEELFEEVASLVVSIKTPNSSGSGVIFGSKDIIATNRHVIGKQKKVVVGSKSQQYVLGTVLRSYPDIDLAFVKASSSDLIENIPPRMQKQRRMISRVHEHPTRVGESVFAIGHPLGLEYTLTQGIVGAIRRLIEQQEYLQIDASINPGNSGGGLFNKYGELVGINTMGYAETQGLNFAIPAGVVQTKYDEMLAELQAGALNYCAVCGFSSKDENYCKHCGSSLGLEESFDELKEAISILNNKRDAHLAEIHKCQVCGVTSGRTGNYCTSCGSEI